MIELVAKDSAEKGLSEEAVKLFDLAKVKLTYAQFLVLFSNSIMMKIIYVLVFPFFLLFWIIALIVPVMVNSESVNEPFVN